MRTGCVIAALSCAVFVGAEASSRPRRATTRMTATAYCDRGATRSGVQAQTGVVAADPHHLPLGTRLRIIAPGQAHAGTYVVADTGSAIGGRDLDIFMPSCRRAKAFGKRIVTVLILRRGAGARDARTEMFRRGR